MRLTDCTKNGTWRKLQWQRREFFVVAVVVVVAAYSPVLNTFFIKDDLALLSSAHIELPEVFEQSWLGGFYRPISELFYGIQYQIFGLTPWPYHLLSIFFHIVATGFVFLIAQELIGSRKQALGAALLFGLHPLHTECVSWISGQMSLLAGVCGLGFLYGLMTLKTTPVSLIGLLLVACLGVGTYESFMVVPGVWIVLWRFSGRNLWWLVGPIASFVLLLGARSIVVGLGTGPYEINPSLSSGLLNIGYYCYLLLGGTAVGGRIINYSLQELLTADNFFAVFPPLFVVSTLLFVAYIVVFLKHARKNLHRTKSIAKYFFLLTVSISLTLLPAFFLDSRPRRIAYIAIAAYSIFLTVAFQQFRFHFPEKRQFSALVFAALCTIFVSTTLSRNFDWRHMGSLEKAMLNTMVSNLKAFTCQQIVVDVPDLVGDALFFHSTSAEFWLQAKEGTHVPVRHAYETQERIKSNLKTCFISVDQTSSEIYKLPHLPSPPNFYQGRNWIIAP